MKEIDEYRNRIRQAVSTEEKKAIAAELHQLAEAFDGPKRAEYELAMQKLREDIQERMKDIDPLVKRAEAILNRHNQPVK